MVSHDVRFWGVLPSFWKASFCRKNYGWKSKTISRFKCSGGFPCPLLTHYILNSRYLSLDILWCWCCAQTWHFIRIDQVVKILIPSTIFPIRFHIILWIHSWYARTILFSCAWIQQKIYLGFDMLWCLPVLCSYFDNLLKQQIEAFDCSWLLTMSKNIRSGSL